VRNLARSQQCEPWITLERDSRPEYLPAHYWHKLLMVLNLYISLRETAKSPLRGRDPSRRTSERRRSLGRGHSLEITWKTSEKRLETCHGDLASPARKRAMNSPSVRAFFCGRGPRNTWQVSCQPTSERHRADRAVRLGRSARNRLADRGCAGRRAHVRGGSGRGASNKAVLRPR
jgi:hypothetical protein